MLFCQRHGQRQQIFRRRGRQPQSDLGTCEHHPDYGFGGITAVCYGSSPPSLVVQFLGCFPAWPQPVPGFLHTF